MKIFLEKVFSKRKRGFTLVEILAVVIILGILATISVPTYNKIIRRSRVADGLNVLELLASAQDKYYVQNGIYAAELEKLNAPLKDVRVSDTPPYTTIDTINFTYSKGIDKTSNCLFAESKDPRMPYTLVKNYKTKATVGCTGTSCDDLTDYVGPVANLSELCPTGQEACQLTDEICKEQGFPGLDPAAKCDCLKNDDPPGTGCNSSQDTPWVDTGENCKYTGPIPEYGNRTSSSSSNNDEPNPGGGLVPEPQGVCGTISERYVCNKKTGKMEKQTQCGYKKCPKDYKLDKSCNCVPYKECNGPIPLCSGGYSKCDPCPSAPDLPSIIEEMYAQNTHEPAIRGTDPGNPPATTECYHCGFRKNAEAPVCDHATGQWVCQGNEDEPCEEISGFMSVYGDACDGDGVAGTYCGKLRLTDVQCKQDCGDIRGVNPNSCGKPYLNPVYGGCVLAPGNACFDGQTKSCGEVVEPGHTNERGDEIGQEIGGAKVCYKCQWSGCVKCGKYTTKYRKCTDPDMVIHPNNPGGSQRGETPRGHSEEDFCGNISSKQGECNYYTQQWTDIFEGSCEGSYYSPKPCHKNTAHHQNERGDRKVGPECYVQKQDCAVLPGTGGMYGWVESTSCEPKASWVECETGDEEPGRVCKDCKWVYKADPGTPPVS